MNRANKISTTPPRRTSQRTAKTVALSALSNKTNIIPNNDRKYPPKKLWKDKRQQQSAEKKATPQPRSPPVVILPAVQRSSQQSRPKKKILARIDLKGVFLGGKMVRPSSINNKPSVKSLRVISKSGKDHSDPFPVKLFQMMEWATSEYPSVCRWSKNGKFIEVDSKSPVLLMILRKHFKHSKWLSFSRQLNNYGFNNITTECYNSKSSKKVAQKFKVYHHPNFFRSIADPAALADLLPYLPGYWKRKEKELATTAATTLAKTKRTRRTLASKSPNGARPVATAPPKSKRTRRALPLKTPNEKPPTAKTVTPLDTAKSISGRKTPSASTTGVSIKTTKKSKKRSAIRSARGLQVTPKASELPPPAPKKRKKTIQVDSLNHEAAVGFLKTPSPQPRCTKAPFISSPPPLSHYLYPKQNHPAINANANFTAVAATGGLLSSNGSPLPSSLMTVNFVMTPSKMKNGERTPRASNLSSSACSPSSSQDGFRMLSWAAQAVESPAMDDHQNAALSSADKTEFMKAVCSPIVPTQKKKKRSKPRNTTKSSTSSAHAASSPAMHSTNSSMMGPSPLSLRGRQDSLSELELLRNCLEDVFVATHANGNGIVAQNCTSATNPGEVIEV